MNLGELWRGHDYAYYPSKGRGEEYRRNAHRVKIISTSQKKLMGNERMSGFAEVLYVDHETGEPLENPDGSHKIREVKARDIALHWEEYADLHEQKELERVVEEEARAKRQAEQDAYYRRLAQEREERAERERLEREERQRVERERKEREQAAIIGYFVSKGIPREAVYNIGADYIYVDRKVIESECLTEY